MVYIPVATDSPYQPLMDSAICSSQYSSYYDNYLALSFLGLLVSIFIIALFYMVATLLRNQNIVSWAKLELYECIVSIVILILVQGVISSACTVKSGDLFPFSKWPDKSIWYAASNTLQDFAQKTLVVMHIQYVFYMFVDFITSMKITAVPLGIGATMKPTLGLGAIIKPMLNNGFSVELISIVSARAQIYVLDYASYGFIQYFLPLGLILRSFTPTRRIGGVIIALTLVFVILYPLFIISLYGMLTDPIKNSIDSLKTTLKDMLDVSKMFWLFVEFMFKYVWGAKIIYSVALMVVPVVAYVFLGGVFFPVLLVLLVITSTRYLSKSLGEELDISNLTRMI